MNSFLRLFLYVYAIPVLIGWSLYQDRIWRNYRLSFGVSAYIIFMFFVFVIRKERTVSFIFKWMFGSVASVLLIVAWAAFSSSKNWVVGSSMLLFVAIYNVAETLHHGNLTKLRQDGLERRGVAIFGLVIALFLFFITLVTTNLTPHYAAYSYCLYVFIIFAVFDFWSLISAAGPPRYLRMCYYTCIWILSGIGLVLIDRRYNNQSQLPWYLIVQPFIGICSAQAVRYISENFGNNI